MFCVVTPKCKLFQVTETLVMFTFNRFHFIFGIKFQINSIIIAITFTLLFVKQGLEKKSATKKTSSQMDGHHMFVGYLRLLLPIMLLLRGTFCIYIMMLIHWEACSIILFGRCMSQMDKHHMFVGHLRPLLPAILLLRGTSCIYITMPIHKEARIFSYYTIHVS